MPDDREAIRELLHHCCFCMDEGRFVELGSLFITFTRLSPDRDSRSCGPASG
jgi:SnoaL-like domain